MNISFFKALQMLAANPMDAPRKAKSFFKTRILRPIMGKLPTGYAFMPVTVSICLTLRCNLRCKQCVSLRPRYTRDDELSIDQWKDVLRQCAKFKPSIHLTGGEPLIFDGIEELLRYGKELQLRMHLQTNGVRLAEMAPVLIRSGVAQTTISIDGPEAVHDSIRAIPGTFKKAVAGIRELVAARKAMKTKTPFIDINCCLLPDNIGLLPDMVDLAADLEVDYLQFQHTIFHWPDMVAKHNAIWSDEFIKENNFNTSAPVIHPEDTYENGITAEMVREQLLPGMDAARKRAAARGIRVGFFPGLSDDQIVPYYCDKDDPFPKTCGWASEFLRIAPNGDVELCFGLNFGNVREKSLAEIWNSESYKRLRLLLHRGIWPGCSRCCGRQFI